MHGNSKMARPLFSKLGYEALRYGVRIRPWGLLSRFLEKQSLINLLTRLRINCVIDVGANKGQYAKALRDLGYEGLLLSFEPISEDAAYIQTMSKGDANWRVFNCAIGSANSEAEFNVIRTASQTVFSSLLDSTYFGGQSVEKRRISVQRLDTVLRDEPLSGSSPRIFLKTDTQGNDIEVIKGCGSLLDLTMGVQCELSVIPMYKNMVHYTDALGFLEKLGFSLLDLNVVKRADDGSVMEYDCVMARAVELITR
jgi:FkbM family methyltransferase